MSIHCQSALPLFFIAHSFGTILGYETAMLLQKQALGPVVSQFISVTGISWTFLSELEMYKSSTDLETLTDHEFVNLMRASSLEIYGRLPDYLEHENESFSSEILRNVIKGNYSLLYSHLYLIQLPIILYRYEIYQTIC
jgi:surfactin synthase thioesterase subunit